MEITMKGCKETVYQIFMQAIRDAKRDGLVGQSAREFLAPSGWARFLAESMGIDPDNVYLIGSLVHG